MKYLLFFLLLTSALAGQPKPSSDQENSKQSKKEPKVFTLVEQMPEFPGGMQAMAMYLQKNIKYPEKARENLISGKCFVKFVVNKKGKVKNVVVLKGVAGCPECDAEALRVVKEMPRWKPAKQNGRKVNCYFNLPISFKVS